MKLSQADRTAIRFVIEQQLKAFQQDDADKAFSFASPGIQAQFGSPQNFMAMVQSAYRAVYRPRSVMFAEIEAIENSPAQKVMLMDSDGELYTAVYVMEQVDRQWRIQGCFLVPISNKQP